ncbi:hypothetical protein [Longitalea luteola]|uniref:hypothetical protein n=1 Tax=Longitalea luteola TaxID=2812563 RepID=UPI001A961C9B|nr:hypothetical protein [Longitalea luteola]
MCHTGINTSRLLFRNIIMLLICTTAAGVIRAQNNSNNLTLTAINTGFTLNNVSAIETQQINPNAFQIVVNSRSSNLFSVRARVSASTSSTGTPFPASMLSLRCNSTSPPVTANTNTITLSNTDQLLQQINSTKNNVTFNYDLLLDPVGYNYAPGNYNLTILFTMTQP